MSTKLTQRLRRSDQDRDRYVYALDGEDGVPCYVGLGKGRRMHHHVRDAANGQFRGNTPKATYLTECLQRGFVPKPYKVADELSIAEARAFEKLLVRVIGRKDLGTGPLLNACDGGASPNVPSPELRRRRSEAARSPEFRERMAHTHAARVGKKLSAEVRARMSLAALARSSPEYSAKIAAANHRRIQTIETRAKIAASKKGRPATQQARASLSAARKGKKPAAKLTAEIVRKIKSEFAPHRGAYAALARQYGMTRQSIRHIIIGKSWRDVS